MKTLQVSRAGSGAMEAGLVPPDLSKLVLRIQSATFQAQHLVDLFGSLDKVPAEFGTLIDDLCDSARELDAHVHGARRILKRARSVQDRWPRRHKNPDQCTSEVEVSLGLIGDWVEPLVAALDQSENPDSGEPSAVLPHNFASIIRSESVSGSREEASQTIRDHAEDRMKQEADSESTEASDQSDSATAEGHRLVAATKYEDRTLDAHPRRLV